MLALGLSVVTFAAMPAHFACAAEGDIYVSIGADLGKSDRKAVLGYLGITEADLTEENTVTVTNKDEYDALGDKVPEELLGTHALSSCLVRKGKKGAGITVKTINTTYVTSKMIQSALATAGMEDAEVTIAAPFEISGTAALVGAMKAYAMMTEHDEAIEKPSDARVGAATEELVHTENLAKETGEEDKVVELIASLKVIVSENKDMTREKVEEAMNDLAEKLEFTLTDEQKKSVLDQMEKLREQNLDACKIKEQAKDVYEAISEKGIDLSEYGVPVEEVKSLWDRIMDFFNSIGDWFMNLF